MRIMLVLLLAACGGDGESRSCVFEDVIARDVPSSAASCGALAVDADDAQRSAARDCAIDSLAADREFVVTWQIRGIDSRIARAIYAERIDGTLALRSVAYDGDPGGGGGDRRPTASTASCGGLVRAMPCEAQDLGFTLCLQCTSAEPLETCASEANR